MDDSGGGVWGVIFLWQLFFQCSKTSPHHLQLFLGLLQHCFAVKLINCFVEYENDSSRVLSKVLLQNVSLHYSGPSSFCTSLHISPVFWSLNTTPQNLYNSYPLKILQWKRLQLSSYWLYSFWWWEMSSCSQVLTYVSAFYCNNTWISTLFTGGKQETRKYLLPEEEKGKRMRHSCVLELLFMNKRKWRP